MEVSCRQVPQHQPYSQNHPQSSGWLLCDSRTLPGQLPESGAPLHGRETQRQGERQLRLVYFYLHVEVKYNYLSFQVLKVQRNKYITAMVIYACLAINCYVWILNELYTRREKY